MIELAAVLCRVAGEYFVAAELSRRGHLASITLRSSRDLDFRTTNRDATKPVAIQGTTSQRGTPNKYSTRKWKRRRRRRPAREAVLHLRDLPPNGEPPMYQVISRREVARLAKEGHESWLATPRRNGKFRFTNYPAGTLTARQKAHRWASSRSDTARRSWRAPVLRHH